ncbi:MAG: DUF6691 family protein [Pseudomonadota bacterium]
MRGILTALASGFVFGLGLVVSQMVNPAKVLGFLDVFGTWDPSLMVVMAAALPPAALGFRLARRRRRPLAAATFRLPTATGVDRNLVVGAILFGIGWGLVGYCPGPAIVALGMGQGPALLFVAAMLAGMGLYELMQLALRRPSSAEA